MPYARQRSLFRKQTGQVAQGCDCIWMSVTEYSPCSSQHLAHEWLRLLYGVNMAEASLSDEHGEPNTGAVA